MHLKEVLHDLADEIGGEDSPFEDFTEFDFDCCRLGGVDWLVAGLFVGAFDDLEDAQVSVLCFDHEEVLGNCSQGFNVGNR